MSDKVVRFPDPERRSRDPDAGAPRNPVDADVIILPVVRVERYEGGADRAAASRDLLPQVSL